MAKLREYWKKLKELVILAFDDVFMGLVIVLIGFSLVSLLLILGEIKQNYECEFTYIGLQTFTQIFEPHAAVFAVTFALTGLWITWTQLRESTKLTKEANEQIRYSIALSEGNLRNHYFRNLLYTYKPYNANLFIYFVRNFDSRIKKYLLEHISAKNAIELEMHFKFIFHDLKDFIDNGDILVQFRGKICIGELRAPLSSNMLYNVFCTLVDTLDFRDAKWNHSQKQFESLYLECIDKKEYKLVGSKDYSDKIKEFKVHLKSVGLDYAVYIS